MSRTIKTNPHGVQVLDAHRAEACHSHHSRGCDLPELTYQTFHERFGTTSCYWSGGWDIRSCGCWSCTGHEWRRWGRRNDRHMVKAELAAVVKYRNEEDFGGPIGFNAKGYW